MINELDKEMISQIFHIGYEAMKLGIIWDNGNEYDYQYMRNKMRDLANKVSDRLGFEVEW